MSDFDRYVAENNIPEEEWPEAFARWIAEHTAGPAPRFEKVEPGDEQILEDREQRELDGFPRSSRSVPSGMSAWSPTPRDQDALQSPCEIERALAATRARQSRRRCSYTRRRRSNDRVCID
jgi:hypothetical protein